MRATRPFAVTDRTFYRCDHCAIVFVEPAQRLNAVDENQRYHEHHNDALDEGYVRFLHRLADPLVVTLPRGAVGLDYGCGPAPVLSTILSATGRPTVAYDPLFFPDTQLLDASYDFVTCSEVAEHAHDPLALFTQLGALTRVNGTIAVMTSFYDSPAAFEGWWYQRDRTHVSFYNEETMRWIARHFGWSVSLPVPNVALFAVNTTSLNNRLN
ncbi:MAG: class I SAM-dependent methyltransferase [bacterium]